MAAIDFGGFSVNRQTAIFITHHCFQLYGMLYCSIIVSYVLHLQMRMLNTAAKLQHFLGRPENALPDLVKNELDPQQYNKTLLLASQCVSEHWKELAQYLGIDPHQHWDVLEESSDGDEKCHEVSVSAKPAPKV